MAEFGTIKLRENTNTNTVEIAVIKMLAKSQKLALVQMIHKRKKVLMSAFSPTITRRAKFEAWNDIHIELVF